MTSHIKSLVVVMMMVVVNGDEKSETLVVMTDTPLSPPPPPPPVDMSSPPQLPLLPSTPPQAPPPPPDPLPGLFVRQETAIRKMDALIAKISKLDDLDTKLDRLTSILQAREDQLEALVEAVEEKVDEVQEKVSAMSGEIGALAEKVEAVGDMVTLLDGKMDDLGGKLEEVDGRLVELREEVNGTLEVERSGEMEEKPLTPQYMSTETISLPHEHIHMLLTNLTLRVEEGVEENSASARACQDGVRHLTEILEPFVNTSHHLAASLVNRIRVSNLAMDKRLGAILHALSLRHQLLSDGLHNAISTLQSNVDLHLQQNLRSVEEKVEEVLRGSTDEMMVILNSTSTSSSTSPSSSSSSSSSLSSPLLLDTLDSILHLSNLTFHHLLQEEEEEEKEEEEERVEEGGERKAPMCVPMDESNTTTTTTTINTNTNTTATPFSLTTTRLQETVREALRERLTHLEDQVSGLRIYLSTSLHVHAGQVEERVARVEAGLMRVVREALSKSNRGLEKLRRASLGYLDAAVTSVSSAAVASAQATADHLSQTLTDVALMLARRMYQVEVAVRAAVGGGYGGDGGERVGWQRWWWWWWCPAMVMENGDDGGGGGACLSALPGNASGWGAARGRCRGVGGDLLTLPPTHTPLHPFLHSTQSTVHSPIHSRPPPIPSFWVGGRRVLGEWRWVTGELVEEEVEEGENGGGGSGDCMVVMVGEDGGVKMAAAPCLTPHPALCQLPPTPGNDPGPPLDPQRNEVTPLGSYNFLTPDDLNLA